MSEDVNPQPGDRKTKPLVYVAGPYTNPDPISNTRTAIEVGMALYDYENVAVLIPHLTMLAHFLEPRLVDDWYRFDLDQLAHCDAVFRIPGESTGADAEIAAAMQMGQPVFNEVAELRAWLVERATPPAPENPYRWAARYWKRHQAWDEGFEACRLAGLQAPPVDDEPVGWANRYPHGWGTPLNWAQARRVAAADALEVAVPLYRRPGVQTPATESEWIMCPECEGDGVTDEYEVCDACHGEGGISAGVQSPPATPGWVVIAGDEVVSDAYSFDDLAVAAKFATDHGGQLCKVVPVPDPETETTDG